MTIQRFFWNYQQSPPTSGSFNVCSPALRMLAADTNHRWRTTNLGCFGNRKVRLGESMSTHAYGAAIDLGYENIGRERALGELLPYLVAWSDEWGIQAIHDYIGCRIWRAGRTPEPADACTRWWKAQRPDSAGMGKAWATWFHVEILPSRWADPSSPSDRGIE